MFFLIAKLYQEYKRADTWNAEERIVLYITFVIFNLFFALFIPFWQVVEWFLNFESQPLLLGIILMVSIFLFTKGRRFVQKKFFKEGKMDFLVKRYKLYVINKLILHTLTILLPLLLFFIGSVLGVFLVGGEIAGVKVEGFFH